MKSWSIAIVLGLAVCCQTLAAEPEVRLCEPWQAAYSGGDANGEQVIALWNFDGEHPLEDASGGGHDLVLEGAEVNPQGRFGAGLQSHRGWPVEDRPHRARAADADTLSPRGPFTIELWIRPQPELDADYPESFLVDKKYVDDTDYQLILGSADRNGARVLRACLGFGNDSSTWYSDPIRFEAQRWYHLALTYDAEGTARFFVDGVPRGSQSKSGRGAIAPGKRFLTIGDRNGSYYHGFPGIVDQVRISRGVLEFRSAGFERTSARTVFARGEADRSQRFRVTNLRRAVLQQGTVTIRCEDMPDKQVKLEGLASGASVEVDYPLATNLRPDAYRLTARVEVAQPAAYEAEETFSIRIVPRQLPGRFPVVIWGGIADDLQRARQVGFTYGLGIGTDYDRIWEAGQPTESLPPDRLGQTIQTLDEALAAGITLAASLSPAAQKRGDKQFQRVDRQGKPYPREDVCGLFPQLKSYCYNVGASVGRTLGNHPAFGAALIHTEVRDAARPCFHPHDFAAYRKASGREIPPEVASPRGVDYHKLPDFPADRVIPDDHPIYQYYRWYWKQGDGWNALNTAVVRGLKAEGRPGIWTWHDPAVRVASVYGSGGEVDVLSQWTYSYPDPIRIGLATDELFAMAAGGPPGQQVMKMTQIIWYRSQTAPRPKPPAASPDYRARWEVQQPDAPFITIAPMHLREAFWTKIARPIQGIMYHGWQSLVPCEPVGGYRYTHPETRHELARLIHQVVEPLGPTLRLVPGVQGDVAFLESFASEMFARRGTYGWNGSWAGDAYHVLMYAKLQPEVVFDETVIERGLDGFRVLVMPDCDVITRRMLQRIKAFQAGGGLIVGDERICPAVKPDIVIPVYQRTGRADQDKQALQALAAGLRKQLDPHYPRYVDTSSPEVIPYRRRYRQADYVFLVNDRREYGRYVGHHRLVMENGLPSETVVSVGRDGGVVYDLVEHRQVPAKVNDGRLQWRQRLGPCDGRAFLVTERAIDAVRIVGPPEIERGKQVSLAIGALDAGGRPVEAIVPLEVSILDAEGRRAEFSGSYAAVDGRVDITLDIAPNDPPGAWTIEARELASDRRAIHDLRVLGPTPWPPENEPVDKKLANPVQPKG